MYSMIVVNDERDFRKGFCQYFPWSEIGFRIVEDFSTAQEANEYLQQHKVDVVVTGIKMPGMSGLELIEAEYKRNRESSFVIVSGYRSFDYAREAMRFGVQHYLLKPIRWAQIKKEFGALYQELDEKQQLRAREKKEEQSQADGKVENDTVRQIKEYIHLHYEDASLESVAAEVKMNPFYLSAFFHNKTGTKFSAYLVSARMTEAARLLKKTSLQIKIIAQRVGYSTPNSFARTFRQYFGISPKEYRMQNDNSE